MSSFSKIKFGVIGCSRHALKNMFPALTSSEKTELFIVGSRDLEKAKKVAEKFNCEKFGTYEDVLNNKEVQAVYISLPNSLHEEWSIKALNAGKHLICEKPAALSYDSAKKMVKAAKENSMRLLEGYMFRHHPQNLKVVGLIKAGVLGDIIRFDGCFAYDMPNKNHISMKKELGGGALYVSGGYPISVSRMIFGEEPESVFCSLKIDSESGIDTKADMVLNYSENKTAFISSAFGSYYQSTYSVLGTKAHIRMGRAYATLSGQPTKIFLDRDDKVEEIIIEPADHFQLMVHDFCEEILKDALTGSAQSENIKNYENDLLAQARILEAARVSDKEKRVVKISEIE